jgi:hypothetical protein
MCARGPDDPNVAGLLLCRFRLSPAAIDGNFFDVKDVWMSRSRGRKTGIHWTTMVPTISEEYQMFEWAFLQKYHASFTFPSSFQFVRTAATMATTIPCHQSVRHINARVWVNDLPNSWSHTAQSSRPCACPDSKLKPMETQRAQSP